VGDDALLCGRLRDAGEDGQHEDEVPHDGTTPPGASGFRAGRIISRMSRALAVLLAAAVAAGATAAGATARSGECEAAGTVCVGALPASHQRVVLKSRNGSGEHGTAAVTLGLHETKVVFRLSGGPRGVRQTVRLLTGGCSGKLLTRLGSIVDGRGVSRGNAISRLSGFAIVVHETTAAGAAVAACGVVPRYVPKR
jgi:hypothetical protein